MGRDGSLDDLGGGQGVSYDKRRIQGPLVRESLLAPTPVGIPSRDGNLAPAGGSDQRRAIANAVAAREPRDSGPSLLQVS